MSLLQTVALAPTLLFAYVALRVLYNLFLHPLRSFPGPLSARATIVTSQIVTLKGKFPHWVHELHQKYGPIVRYAPNEVSFIEASAWKEIYGHRSTNFVKSSQFYGPDAFGHPPGLIRADDTAHARQRKLVSHAFSDKALREQEPLLKVYAKLLIKKLKERATGSEKVDLVSWYNFTTFDIMADLTFGEPLRLLEDTQYTPWVKSIFGNIKVVSFTSVIRRWNLLNSIMQQLLPAKAREMRKVHMSHSSDRVDKRLARKTDRPDIWTYVLRHSDSKENAGKGLLPTEMYSNAGLFMLAGTETTATELSGITYYLLKNPEKLARLQKEVRSAFSSFEDVTMAELSQLEYLCACITEGLRIYPPVAVGLPRTAPKGGATVTRHYIPEGTTVSVAQFAAYHSTSNFKNPDSFVPERWMPEGQEEYGKDNKDALNAFSYGPRNCLGKNLAYHEMRLILASVMLNFDLELCDESDGWPNQDVHILWAKGELNVKLTPVNM